MMFVLSCIHVNHLCILYLYYFLVVVHRGPHGRLAFFFAKCVTLKIKPIIISIIIIIIISYHAIRKKNDSGVLFSG